MQLRAVIPQGHWKTVTFVGGLTRAGFIAPMLLDGPMDGEIFRAWCEQMLAPLPVFRLDADVAGGRGALLDVLGRFDSAGAGVLLGTQMVAKGHDFPAVTLGVVIDADATLRFPDFRSEERTFSLVAQLAGRSGRDAHSQKP